jgi:ribonucleoside-diphosphate reductase beta chain
MTRACILTALAVIDTVRSESPELPDAEFEKQIVAMMEEAVDCETALAEDLLGQGVAGLSLKDMRAYLESVADQRLQSFGIKKRYGTRNPFSFIELQDVQESCGQFLRTTGFGLPDCGERSPWLHEEFRPDICRPRI